jgi:hypothetical protein
MDDIDPGRLGRHGLAARHRDAGVVGEFEGHVFNDMAKVGTLAEPLDEAPRAPSGAVMLVEAWESSQQPIDEAGEITALATGEVLEVQGHRQHRLVAEDVGAGQRPNGADLHGAMPGGA